MSKPKVKVVLSYSGMLRAFARGEITIEDLNGAVFYFGCTREYAMNPESSDARILYTATNVKGNSERRRELHSRILEVVLQAEAEGRAAYRDFDESRSIAMLNELLGKCGLPAFDRPESSSTMTLNEHVRAHLGARHIKRLELID